MRFSKMKVRWLPLLHFCFLLLLVMILAINALLHMVEAIYPLFLHTRIQPQSGCNGYPELCNRSYANITQIGTHGSPFVGILPTMNQNVQVTTQLDSGIRFLQAQTHLSVLNILSLCHTSCFLSNAGPVQNYLAVVKDWLDKHLQEVVTILFTNGDHVDIREFDQAFVASGIKPYAYIPTYAEGQSTYAWPTLGEMITNGTRLVVFLDSGASPRVPYILGEFAYFWETPFDSTGPAFFRCDVDRGRLVSDANMYIMNHFLDTNVAGMLVPDRRDAAHTNAARGKGSIGAQAGVCIRLHGRPPSVILVDYFEQGAVFEAQSALNGLPRVA